MEIINAEAEAERQKRRGNSGVCRCCLLEGMFGTMERSYSWYGITQTYSEMLRDIFGITLTCDRDDQLICGICEIRLRQVFTFRRQVLNSNKNFIKIQPTTDSEDRIASKEENSMIEFIEDKSENVHPDIVSGDELSIFNDDAPVSIITQADTSTNNAGGNQSKLSESTINNSENRRPEDDNQIISMPNLSAEIIFKTKNLSELKYTMLNCIFCSELFESKLEFTSHSGTCELRSKKILPKRCRFCLTTFDADAMLISKHMWTEHRYKTEYYKNPRLKCDICSKKFSNITSKVLHIRRSHHTCKRCRKVFLNIYEKYEHELSHPLPGPKLSKPVGQQGPSQCPECSEVFASVKLLKIHIYLKHGHKCGKCKKRFGRRAMLEHKIEAHSQSMQNCNACDKSFYTEGSLRTHQRRHHMQEKNVSCPQCDYVAFDKTCLKRHMICHTKDKPFLCLYCNKGFSRLSTLTCHKLIHTGDKRKVCKVCAQAFVQRASLKYHMEKYHPGEL